MPIYEYQCNYWDYLCGRFELIRPMAECDEKAQCPNCGALCARVPSLVTMRPDALWAGHYIENYGYVTSSSKVAQIRKERHLVEVGDRADRDAMHKTAADARKAKKEKFAKETRAFIEKEFVGKGMLDSFGEITPEANRKLSDEPILE